MKTRLEFRCPQCGTVGKHVDRHCTGKQSNGSECMFVWTPQEDYTVFEAIVQFDTPTELNVARIAFVLKR